MGSRLILLLAIGIFLCIGCNQAQEPKADDSPAKPTSASTGGETQSGGQLKLNPNYNKGN